MSKPIRITKVYDSQIEKVWEAITNPEAISQWLMPCDFRPEVGHEFTFRAKPTPGFDGVVHCKVLALEAPHLLSYSWTGGSLKNTIVTFKLKKDNDKTILDFEHSGFEGLLNNLIVKKILSNGWKKMFRKKLIQHL